MASLFERLEAARGAGGGPPHPAGLADSVLRNVRRTLNARQGCCQTRRDLGLPDLGDLSEEASEAVPAVARAVRLQLERFEPRLRQVTVRPAPSEETAGGFTFAISATLADGSRPGLLRFDAVVGRDGQVRLKD